MLNLPSIETNWPEDAGTDTEWTCYVDGCALDSTRLFAIVNQGTVSRIMLFAGQTIIGVIRS